MAVFKSMLSASDARPRAQFFSGNSRINFIRDALSLPTWLALGAFAQAGLCLVIPTQLAVLPAFLYLATSLIDLLLVSQSVRANHRMDGVVVGKASAQIPGSTTPASYPLLAIKLAARSNHPLGTAHPHLIKIGGFFQQMIRHLDDNSQDYNYLGAQTYLGVERATANEIMVMVYFRDYAGLHKFAHTAEVHKTAWRYWNKEVMKDPVAGRQFAIMHETLQVPARSWESIYINYHPTGIGATTFSVQTNSEDGIARTQWANPLVDASRGVLSTSKGRMAASKGDEDLGYKTFE
ncbi:hypothetical protein Sste5346_009125 [Sporothrix stenoceras]|uniref:ABM domain-containing protein n=1 Tax=Sporothrix stenoceras TaxID=5173 RepID=A0ABR3YL31_9PEZI